MPILLGSWTANPFLLVLLGPAPAYPALCLRMDKQYPNQGVSKIAGVGSPHKGNK